MYNIKSVAKMLDMPAVTIRAWERRYHVVSPTRSESGHRLYSEQDIEDLHAHADFDRDRAYRAERVTIDILHGGNDLLLTLVVEVVKAEPALDVHLERKVAVEKPAFRVLRRELVIDGCLRGVQGLAKPGGPVRVLLLCILEGPL